MVESTPPPEGLRDTPRTENLRTPANQEPDLETEVLIVGAGPVGLIVANFLGLYGHSAIVAEQLPELIDYPRGVGIDDESLRTIQALGLSEQVAPHTTPQHIMRVVNGRGKVILTNAPKADEFGWPRKNGFIQPMVDAELAKGLDAYEHVQLRFGHEVTNVTETEDFVEADITVTDTEGNTSQRRVRARYLVGTEGGKSPTRKRMGVSFEGQSPATRWLVVDVNNDPLGTPNVFLGADPKRPYVSIGLAHAVRRWEFMIFDHESDEEIVTKPFIHDLLKDHVPDPSSLDVIRERVFTHHGRIAGSFRKGRQIIAGDAAHLMPVWMGQGWNSGARDATNLAWKLAMILDGDAGPDLLDTYTAERTEHAKSMIDLSLTLGSVIKPTNPAVAAARDAVSSTLNLFPQIKSYFSDMRFKPMPRYHDGVLADPTTFEPGHAKAKLTSHTIPVLTSVSKVSPVGVQFIQPDVSVEDGTQVKLDDALGSWWAILAWGNDPQRMYSPDELALAHKLRARFVQVVPQPQRERAQGLASEGTIVVGDVTGRLKQWFDDRPTPVLVIRPDRFVAGASLAQTAGRTLRAVTQAAHLSIHSSAPYGGANNRESKDVSE